MHFKQIIGWLIFLMGIALIGFAFYAKSRVDEAKKNIHTASQFFSQNPLAKQTGKIMEGKAEQYDKQIKWCFIGGGVLVVVGGIAIFAVRKKKGK